MLGAKAMMNQARQIGRHEDRVVLSGPNMDWGKKYYYMIVYQMFIHIRHLVWLM